MDRKRLSPLTLTLLAIVAVAMFAFGCKKQENATADTTRITATDTGMTDTSATITAKPPISVDDVEPVLPVQTARVIGFTPDKPVRRKLDTFDRINPQPYFVFDRKTGVMQAVAGQSSRNTSYLDDNGNPITPKKTVWAGADSYSFPLEMSENEIVTVMRSLHLHYPGDPISQIKARKANPLQARFGDPRGEHLGTIQQNIEVFVSVAVAMAVTAVLMLFVPLRKWLRVILQGLRLSMLPRVIAAALLLVAPASAVGLDLPFFDYVWGHAYLPRGFFTGLRWFVCGTAALTGAIAYTQRKWGWTWVAAMLTVLFNPLRPLYFANDTWVWIDAMAALIIGSSIPLVRERPKAVRESPILSTSD